RQVRRARLGPAALNPYTLHPVEIAGQIAALDMACEGHAYLGLARGSWLEAVGIRPDRPVTRLRECVHIVRALLAGETDGFVGSVFSLAAGRQLEYRPRRPR